MRDEGLLNLILRLLWFYFIGLWVGGLWVVLAWLACVTVLGLPVGLWMFHQVPSIMTLRDSGEWRPVKVGGRVAYVFEEYEQSSFALRVLWFVLLGWWLSALWLKLAFLCAATFIFVPVAFWMFNQVPFVMTLRR